MKPEKPENHEPSSAEYIAGFGVLAIGSIFASITVSTVTEKSLGSEGSTAAAAVVLLVMLAGALFCVHRAFEKA